jgi:ABC transporter substrate binding protein
VKRREFIGVLGGVAAWPVVARAQQATREARIGFLSLAPASAWANEVAAFLAGLHDLGYVEGKNVVIEFRWADTVDQLPKLAAELVRTKVDVIIAPASTEVEPVRQATKTIPIVFAQHADPVGLGHVASLAHPGGNITGVSMVLTELAAKALQILNDAMPSAKQIGVLWNPTTPSHTVVVKEVQVAAKDLGLQLIMLPIRTVADFEGVFSTMARERADGFSKSDVFDVARARDSRRRSARARARGFTTALIASFSTSRACARARGPSNCWIEQVGYLDFRFADTLPTPAGVNPARRQKRNTCWGGARLHCFFWTCHPPP